ncbi:MAG: pantoate--beta-alanine ligase [Alphaproteobacteria bacterium]|nr:pantoate--beta-alanine ligase [Alphaproteobacteria bacterium]MCD8570437.1 pantoate--beta-alanine ligase [Alphaproteobacteria bacterium]
MTYAPAVSPVKNSSTNKTMHIARTRDDLQSVIQGWKADGLRVGFVPTMGALHDGHISLMTLAAQHADKVIASIFVNPTQFAPHEDFAQYPRTEADDLQKLEAAGVALVYLPTEDVIYEGGREPRVSPGKAAEGLESDFRPHFFGGVVNVVERLFSQVTPDIAMFGEKDFQQLQVIAEMVQAYDMPIEIIGGPIARDSEGLALSSRNAYLSAEELQIARQMNKILRDAARGEITPPQAASKLLAAGFDKIDYVEKRWNRILAAAWLGKTRLIDNMPTQ